MKEQMRVKNLNEADHSFYRKLLVVGIPMVIQQVIAVTLNLADTIMVGKVGENALAAVGAANRSILSSVSYFLVYSAVRLCMRFSTGASAISPACARSLALTIRFVWRLRLRRSFLCIWRRRC